MVEQRDGQRVMKLAYLKKSIYSLCPDLAAISRAANHRYIDFLSAIDDATPGIKALSKISDSVEEREHRYPIMEAITTRAATESAAQAKIDFHMFNEVNLKYANDPLGGANEVINDPMPPFPLVDDAGATTQAPCSFF